MVFQWANTDEHKSHLGKIGFTILIISGFFVWLIYDNSASLKNTTIILWIPIGQWVIIFGIGFLLGLGLTWLGIKKWGKYRGYWD